MGRIQRHLLFILFLLFSSGLLWGAPLYQGVMSVDGTPLYMAVYGKDEAKPAMVCLSFGPGSSSRYLEESLPPLFEGTLRLVFIDYYYSGRSLPSQRPLIYDRRPIEGITPSDQADLILSLMTTLGIEKFGILGHDFGAFVGTRLIQKAPERILFFAGVSPRLNYPDELARLTQKLDETYDTIKNENSVNGLKAMEQQNRISRLRSRRIHSPEDIETLFSLLGNFPDLSFYQPVEKKTKKTLEKLLKTGAFLPVYPVKEMLPYLYSSSYYTSDETILLRESSCPLLLLYGESDFWLPPSEGAIQNGLSYETIPRSSFFPMLENPRAFKAALLDFLRLHHIIGR